MRKLLILLVSSLCLTLGYPGVAEAAPQTVVSKVAQRSATTVLAVNSPAAIFEADRDIDPVCRPDTYMVVYATWNVRQVTATKVTLASIKLRITAQRPYTLAGGYIGGGSGSHVYRIGETDYPAGVTTLTYTVNKTMTVDSSKQLKLRQNFEFGGASGEAYYCGAPNFIGQWLKIV